MRNRTQPLEADLQRSIDRVQFVVNVALLATHIPADTFNVDYFECTTTKFTICVSSFIPNAARYSTRNPDKRLSADKRYLLCEKRNAQRDPKTTSPLDILKVHILTIRLRKELKNLTNEHVEQAHPRHY